MKVKFCGATKEVTGSKHLLTINGVDILLDCGLRQSSPEETLIYNRNFLFDPAEVDFLLLSHAHLDHCGNIPTLYKQGFRGDIYSTQATKDLSKFIALDAVGVQKKDANYIYNEFGKIIKPLYTEDDVEKAWQKFITVQYKKTVNLTENIKVTFYNAGHILGSAQILLEFKDQADGKEKSLLFTGDLGRKDLPILKDPDYIDKANYVISESTYGNSVHDNINNVYQDLTLIINDVYKRGGKVLIPAFAMERTQELLYVLHSLVLDKKIPEIPIFVDGPLAYEITKVYESNHHLFDKESHDKYFSKGLNPLQAKFIKHIKSVNDSKKINGLKGSAIILSGSGMLSGGRMLHHLRHNLSNPKNLVLIVGYTVENSLGRNLLENQGTINIFSEDLNVRAEVLALDSLSGHADKLDLLNYLPNIKDLEKIFLVHGDESEMIALKRNLDIFTDDKLAVTIPSLGEEKII